MKKEINHDNVWTKQILKELTQKTIYESPYQILDIYKCESTGFLKAKIKSNQGRITHQKIVDLVNKMEFLETFDKKVIRSLSYLAALESTKPDYSIVSQQ